MSSIARIESKDYVNNTFSRGQNSKIEALVNKYNKVVIAYDQKKAKVERGGGSVAQEVTFKCVKDLGKIWDSIKISMLGGKPKGKLTLKQAKAFQAPVRDETLEQTRVASVTETPYARIWNAQIDNITLGDLHKDYQEIHVNLLEERRMLDMIDSLEGEFVELEVEGEQPTVVPTQAFEQPQVGVFGNDSQSSGDLSNNIKVDQSPVSLDTVEGVERLLEEKGFMYQGPGKQIL